MVRDHKSGFWYRKLHLEAGFNLSWGAVLAGVVTFFAVFTLFSLITTAIGLGKFDPTSSKPFDGVGQGMAIWTVVSMIVSLFAGGFVAGLSARRTGLLHGFLTWALSIILIFALLTSSAVSAVGFLGRTLGAVTSAVGSATGSVASGVANIAGDAFSSLGDTVSEGIKGVDGKALGNDTEKILRDTGIKELQPEYLNDQLNAAKDEALKSLKNIAVHPDKADEIVGDLSDKLQKRIDGITSNIDKDAISKAVAKNSSLNEEEAKKAVDNAVKGLENAQEEAKKQLESAKQSIQDMKTEVDNKIQEARQTAADVSHAAARATVVVFIGLLIAACLTSFAGLVGSSYTKEELIVQK